VVTSKGNGDLSTQHGEISVKPEKTGGGRADRGPDSREGKFSYRTQKNSSRCLRIGKEQRSGGKKGESLGQERGGVPKRQRWA